MPIALTLVLLLAAATAVSAQQPAPVAPLPGQVQAEPLPKVTPLRPVAVEPAHPEVRTLEQTPATAIAVQEGPSRTVWFLIGALTVAAIILAFTL